MNTQIRILTFTLAQYNAIAAIHNAAWQATSLSGANRQRHDAGRHAKFLFQRLVAESDGQIVAHNVYPPTCPILHIFCNRHNKFELREVAAQIG